MAESAPLNDPDELLHRQVNPAFVQDGRVGSQAFKPTPKDAGKLSVSRDALASAEEAFTLFTAKLGLSSAGVWSVTVGECSALGLSVHPDPLVEPVEDQAHAFVDFSARTGGETSKLAKRLAALARSRGCRPRWQSSRT